jgi:hypothetical protein
MADNWVFDKKVKMGQCDKIVRLTITNNIVQEYGYLWFGLNLVKLLMIRHAVRT